MFIVIKLFIWNFSLYLIYKIEIEINSICDNRKDINNLILLISLLINECMSFFCV